MNNRRRRAIWRFVGLAGVATSIVLLLIQNESGTGLDLHAPIVRTLSDGRSGSFSFRSYTLDREDVVRGKNFRNPVAISANLQLPESMVDGAVVPAAVLFHGSDGLTGLQSRYARTLRESGVATLVIDSFSGRGIRSTIGRQSSLATDSMVGDAYTALALLSTHPRIDTGSVTIIGWSKGGVASLWSARESFGHRFAEDSRRFAAHVAFYPWCGEREADITLTGAPILVLSGELDDWSGTHTCVEYVAQAKRSGYDARIVVYENAHHGFDYEGSFHTFLPHAVNWSGCAYVARKTGFLIAESGWFSAWPDLARYLRQCSTPGAHVASNSYARKRVADDLFGFLRDVLRVES